METKLKICSYEQAKALKELGFDWEVDYYYSERTLIACSGEWNKDSKNRIGHEISAPTVALALKWCRDVKRIENGLMPKCFCGLRKYCWWYNNDERLIGTSDPKQHEAAESALLDEIIKYLKSE